MMISGAPLMYKAICPGLPGCSTATAENLFSELNGRLALMNESLS